MKYNIKLIQCLIVITTGSVCVNTEASLVWDWSIDDPVQVVLPTDSVVFMVTLRNDISSTEYLYGTNIRDRSYWVSSSVCCSAALLSEYTLVNPGMGGNIQEPDNFFSQFYNMTLAPGESFNFVFLSLVPRTDSVNIGIYDFNSLLGFSYLTIGTAPVMQFSQASPSIVVQTVPIPSAAILLLSGLLSLLSYLRSGYARTGGVS